MKVICIILGVCLLFWSCQEEQEENKKDSMSSIITNKEATKVDEPNREIKEDAKSVVVEPKQDGDPKKEPDPSPKPRSVAEKPHNQNNSSRYTWLENYDEQTALVNQIAAPVGYQRVKLTKGSFGEWLRYLPLLAKGTKVSLYNGQEKPYQRGANRVINIDIGNRDLQQCADAVMRLKAEYHYSQKAYSNIHFNYTSGHKVAFEDWRKGKKPKVKGGKVSFSAATGNIDNSYSNFQKYMRSVFMYAGTASLEKEMQAKKIEDLVSGDVFIKGGYPGHAILILDVVENPKTGHKLFLVAQSYMPAQSIHVLNNFNEPDLSPWYPIDFGETLETPEWSFAKEALHQFKN